MDKPEVVAIAEFRRSQDSMRVSYTNLILKKAVADGEQLIRLSDYDALAEELDRQSVITGNYIAKCQRLQDERDALKAQVQTLQAHPDSWQSGYAKGRTDGTKAAMHERDELRTALAQTDALASEAAQRNEELGRRVRRFEGALRDIAAQTYDEWTNGAEAGRIANAALSQQAKP